MKEVYVLLGEISYEGYYLLGVYSSAKRAEKAREDFMKTEHSFCDVSIHARSLNGVAECKY